MWARLLDVRAGEGRSVLLLGGHFFLLLAATGVLMTAAESIFLAVYPYTWVPYTYIGGAAVAGVASLAYGAMDQRTRPQRRSQVALGSLAGMLVLLRILVMVWPSGGPFVLWLVASGFGVIVGMESGNLIARALNARQARRLYPAISGIGGMGATVGSFLVAGLAKVLPAEDLLWIAALFFLAPIALSARVTGEATRERVKAEPAPWREVFRKRFPVLLITLVFLAGIISTTAKYQLSAAVKESLSKDEITSYLGVLYGFLSAASILFGFLVTRHVVARWGVGASLAIYPVLVTTAGAFGLVVPGLAVASGALFTERLVRQNLQRPLLNIAMMPLPPNLASRTAVAIRGAVENPAIALTSVALLIVGPHIPWQSVSVVLLVAGALSVACAWAARRRYASELVGALHTRRLETMTLDDTPWTMDARTREALHEQLESETPDRAALALRLLSGRANADTVQVVRARWPTWRPWVRVEAVRALATSRATVAEAFLSSLDPIADPDAFAERLRCQPTPVPPDVLRRCLASNHPPLAATAAIRVRQDGEAVGALSQWEASEDPAWRQAAITVHAATRAEDDPHLVKLLDEAPDVVLAEAVRRPLPALADALAHRLTDDQRLPAVSEALLRIGIGARDAIARAASDPPRAAQSMALLLRLEDEQSRAVVFGLAMGEAPTIRGHALRAWLRARRKVRAAEGRQLKALAEREYALCQIRHAARAHPEPVVREEAARLLARALERLFLILALLEPRKTYRRVHLSLTSDVDSERAFAVEALDEILPDPWRERLLPLLDAGGHVPGAAPELDGDPALADLASSLKDPDAHPHLATARTWQAVRPLDALALTDLRAVARVAARTTPGGAVLQIRDGLAANLSQALRDAPGESNASGVPMAALWRVLAARPPAARAWLRRLAAELVPPAPLRADVSLSGTSLASRTEPDDAPVTDDLRRWQGSFYLRLVPFFAPLSPARLRAIAQICRVIPMRAGTKIVTQGRPAGHAYVVCSGTVDVRQPGASGSTLQAGEAFGVLALLSGSVRQTNVTATTDGELLAIDRVDFADLLAGQPGLVPAFSRLLAERAQGIGL